MSTIYELSAPRERLIDAVSQRRRRAFLPPPRLTADAWADAYRIVPTETSSTPGPWRTSTVEVARGPMRAISDPAVRRIVIMASAQIMKTSTLEVAIGYHMHLDPCPMLLYSASRDTIDATVTKKIDPMIVNTPELAALWGGARALEVKNDRFTKYQKQFPGGDLELLTINSTANLRNRAAKLVCVDEVDDCQQVADGDPVSLAEARTISFKNSEKLILVSTPTIRGSSKIEAEYQRSDMRKPYLACPHCGEWDYLRWRQISYKNAEGVARPELAQYFCEHCGCAWDESDRIRALTTEGAIQYRQTRPFRCCDEHQSPEIDRLWSDDGLAVCRICGDTPIPVTRAGFWGWIAYHPRWSLADIVRDWLDRQGDKSKLQEFINNRLAETWVENLEESVEVDPDQFAARVEPVWDALPAEIRIITAGVDVQPAGSKSEGRLEVELVGWGDGEETWSVAYHVIPGDPDQGHVWAALDDILMASYPTDDGRSLHVQATCVDTGGHNIDAVMSYAGRRAARRVWAIKGASETGLGRQPIWPIRPPETVRHGAKLYTIGTLAAKDWAASCIRRTQPGPGYMHVPADRHASWFEQLTNEKRVAVQQNGRRGSTWRPRASGVRTEALDCRGYAKAALEGLKRLSPRLSRLIQSASAVAPVQNEANDQSTNTEKTNLNIDSPISQINKSLPKRKARPIAKKRSSFW